MITHEEAKLQLQQVVMHAGFHEAVIEGLVAVATDPEWTSESIEHLLIPIQAFLLARGIPAVGSTGSDLEAFEFWSAVGDQALPWDPYKGDRAAAHEGWLEAVAGGDTMQGFTDWWDGQVETARHNL